MKPVPPRHERAVLTLALGPEVYWNMAINLARSVRRWHDVNTLPIAIVTDRTDPVPPDLRGVETIRLQDGELGVGFETKLHLDRLAPGRHTLFIDADCLVYAPLDELFQRMRGRPVATAGGEISTGDWFGDVAALCRRLGVRALPAFNGGLYYLEPGPVTTEVYRQARAMVADYDALGLVRLRGLPNEELLMASAMASHGLAALPDEGEIMSDPQQCPGPVRVNILRGYRLLVNPPPPSPLHRPGNRFARRSPLIVHFLNDHTRRTPYRTDVRRLALAARGYPDWLASLVAEVLVGAPGRAQMFMKDTLRPLYHRIFGARPVGPSDRIA